MDINELCADCIEKYSLQCVNKEDTKPKDCVLIKYYLELARAEATPEYEVFVRFSDISYTYFIAKEGIVVAEHNNHKALIGEIMLRKSNPEWF